MYHCRIGLIGLLWLLGVQSSPPCFAQTTLPCSQVSDTFDATTPWQQWAELPTTPLQPHKNLQSESDADFSGRVILAWNSRYFFIIARITDDLFHPGDSMSSFWNHDSIQFAFAPSLGTTPDQITHNTFYYGAANLPFGAKVMTTSVPAGYPTGMMDVAFEGHYEDGVLTYIIALPWRYTGSLNPLKDDLFRFNLIANENDGARRLGWLQLSDGIGDAQGIDLFQSVQFLRHPSAEPQIHITTPQLIVESEDRIEFTVSVGNLGGPTNLLAKVGSKIQRRSLTLGFVRKPLVATVLVVKPFVVDFSIFLCF